MKKTSFSTSLKQTIRVAFVAYLLFILSLSVSAQSSTDGQTPLGLKPGSPAGSYPLSDFETVNLFNGNLNFQMPLLSIGGRGGTTFPLTIHIDQKWTISKEINPGHTAYYFGHSTWWSEDDGGNHTITAGRVRIRRGGSEDFWGPTCGIYRYKKTLTRVTFIAPDGTEYELRDASTQGQPYQTPSCSTGLNRGRTFSTADGTAATFVSDTDIIDAYEFGESEYLYYANGYLTLKDGTRFHIVNDAIDWMRDRNGNKVTFAYDVYKRVTAVTDSLNRQISITYDNVSGSETYDQISYKGFGGAARTVKVVHGRVLRSDLSVPSPLFPGLTGVDNSNPAEIIFIEIPDGRRYQLQYNAYSEIARIVMPTGGAIEYDWDKGLTDGDASGLITVAGDKYVYRRVVERRVYPDGGTGTAFASRTTYSRPETTTTNAGYVLVNQYNSSGTLLGLSKHYLYGSARDSFAQKATDYAAWQDGKEYKTETFDTNGTTLLRKVENTFAQRAAVSWWTGGSSTAPPNDVRATETVSTLADSNQVSKQTFGYDDTVPFNNRNNVKEYDFGSGTAGALLRETRTTFVTDSSYTGTSVHLRSLPSQVSVYDGSGILRAQNLFEYDNYGTADSFHANLATFPTSGSDGLISGFDSSFNSTTTNLARGNVTKTTRNFLNTSGSVTGSISSYSQYDAAGNVVKAIDPRSTSGNIIATIIEYADRFGSPDGEAQSNGGTTDLPTGKSTFAFPTRVTNAANQISYSQFDYYLGRPVNSEDVNGIVAAGYYNDPLDRPTQVIRAFNNASTKNQTGFVYNDTGRTVTTSSDQTTYGDNLLQSKIYYDPMGRTFETRQYEDGTAYIATNTEFDALGRAYRTSNPYRSGDPVLWTTSVFDALGRVTSVTTPDSAMVSTSYSGNTVTVADQNGKARKSVTDGLGRLSQVYEDPNGLNYLTSYTYDALDNLITVSQGTQTRTFVYDSLKRLTSAANPESGTISYQYDANGNLAQKTDARSVTATYAYDALNRVTSRSYSDSTPAATYTYDSTSITNGKGRLASIGSSVSTYTYNGYDAIGKPTSATETLGSQNYSVGYTYDLAGHVTAMTYPSGRTVNYSYDSAGRMTTFGGNLGDGTTRSYSSEIIYAPLGGMTKEKFGTTTALYNKLFYNSRGQLSEIRESSSYTGPSDTTWNRGAIINHYSNGCWGMCGGSTSTTSMTDNDGNLKKQEVYVPANEQLPTTSYTTWYQQYDYDALNRLQRVHEYTGSTPVDWQQEYTYDRYGNRLINGAVDKTYGAGINNLQMAVSAATNRMYAPGETDASHTQVDYDAAGNQTKDLTAALGAGTRVYDGESRMTIARDGSSNQIAAYTYDAEGRRVKRNLTNQIPAVETWQVYGIGGELLAEYAANGAPASPKKEYGYRNGQLLVTAEPPTGQPPPLNPQNVSWTNVSSTITPSGNSIQKTSGTNAWDSGAVSTQTIASGNGYVDFVPGETGTWRMCGLGNGDTGGYFADIDYAFFIYGGGGLSIYESGIDRGSFGSYAASDHLKVAVENGAVKYYRNGTLLYTSTVAPTYPLMVDTSLNTVNAGVYNVVLANNVQNVSWTNVSSTITPSGNSIQKTSGTNAWDSGAVSTQTIASGNGYMDFVPGETGTWRMCGLGNGDTGGYFADIDYAFFIYGGGGLSIYESGIDRGSFGSYAASDHLKVAVENGAVKYYRNGTLLYTSTVAPTYPLMVDTSLNTVNAGVYNVTITSTMPSANASLNWLVTDHLGTPRMVFDQSGALATTKRHDYLPFGEELFNGARTTGMGYATSDGVRQKFTDKERDIETGLDYFLSRHYSSTQGRFTAPDPLSAPAGSHPRIPQSWNLYAYVLNNPLKLIDPDGMMWIYHYLDKEHKKIGIAWIDGNKIPKNLSAQGYQALNFGGQSSADIRLTNGSVVRLSANSANPLQLSGPQQSGSGGGYVNTGLIRELGRQTAPMPAATGLFILFSLNGGYAIAGSSVVALDAVAYALYAAKATSDQDQETQVMATVTQYDQTRGKPGSIRNVYTDVSKEDFIKNLEASGFKATKSGNATILDNGVSKYTVYDVARSTGGPSAARSIAGEQTMKIRLKP